jgi:hypothetical protein
VVHVHDLVDDVSWEAETAGASAARFAREERLEKRRRVILKPGRNIRYVVPQAISAQNDVTLYARVKDMEENVQLKVGNILAQSPRVVKPGEMLKLNLSQSQLSQLNVNTAEIIVECKKRS